MATTFITHTDTQLELITADHMNDVQTAINNVENGWVVSEDTWVYASASTFTIAAKDVTSIYTTGTKLKCTNGSAKYFYVVSSTFSTNTTVTVTGGSDYALANSTISAAYYSYANNPQAFPAAFAYTPTGISNANATLTGRFSVQGRRCFVDFKMVTGGAITFTTHPTLPITASASHKTSSDAQTAIAGVAAYWDNGTARVAYTMYPSVLASGTTFGLYRAADGVAIAATVPITWAANDELTAHLSYEI